MSIKILINAVDSEECRIAKVKESKLEEFHVESAAREIIRGNIYKGIITRVEPSLQAAFIDFGGERHGFLQKHEIHSDYFLDHPAKERSIKHIIKRGQNLMVQVVKDPFMRKGAMLTTFISLPGRHIVLMPGSKSHGISRKIEDETERNRLKEIIGKLSLPQGFGIIIRTAGMNCTKTAIANDLKYLLKLWKTIKQKGIDETSPATLYKERSLAVRSIRDYFTPDVNEILIDDETVYKEIKNFINIISHKHNKIVKLHKSDKPIFTKFQLESQIESIYNNRVLLKSGGSIVIEQTEALVAIDVNSGKATQKEGIEQTALLTNIEAAEEISRQLQLRDLGGLIVLDFIDMRNPKHRTEVEKKMRTFAKADKAKIKIGKISKFGLMEMSRQRIRPSIDFGSHIVCKYCKGKGLTPSIETLGLAFLRKLKLETLKSDVKKITGTIPIEVADYILNQKRKDIVDLEVRHNISINIIGEVDLIPGDCKIINEKSTQPK